MTPDELRKLADEATPGPWALGPNMATAGRTVSSQARVSPKATTHIVARNLAVGDQRLIALAPDLARLCAEAAAIISAPVVNVDLEREASWFAKLAELEPVT